MSTHGIDDEIIFEIWITWYPAKWNTVAVRIYFYLNEKQQQQKKKPKDEVREHVDYYIIILVYLLLHLVFLFVMYACNYLFKSYLDSLLPCP